MPRWFLVPVTLLLLAALIAAARLWTFHEPLERDIITYMLIGHAVNQGGQVYVDGWDLKPPGVYAAYALAEQAAGFGERQVYFLNVAAAILTLLGVYAAGAVRGQGCGLWAATFWALICGAPRLEANQPNTEVLINACVVWALALLLRGGGWWRGLAAGALFALGTTFKQTVILDAMLLSCAHVAWAKGLPGGRRRALVDVALIAAVGAVCWFGLIGYYAATGRFEIFYLTLFRTGPAYAGNPLFNLYRYFREARFFPQILWFTAPLGGLILLGALRDYRLLRKGGEEDTASLFLRRCWGLYLTALVALQLKIVCNGPSFLPHYYQFWLPMLAIGAGWAAGAGSRVGWSLAGAGVAVFLLLQQGQYFLLPADEWSRLKYGSMFLDGRNLGRAIGTVLQPGERLYQHGDRPEIYFYSGQLPPSGLLWIEKLGGDWPAAEILLAQHQAALQKTAPDLIVIEQVEKPKSAAPEKPGLIGRLLGTRSAADNPNAQKVLDALLPGYRPVEIKELQGFPDFRFYVRRDSPLDRRLRH